MKSTAENYNNKSYSLTEYSSYEKLEQEVIEMLCINMVENSLSDEILYDTKIDLIIKQDDISIKCLGSKLSDLMFDEHESDLMD